MDLQIRNNGYERHAALLERTVRARIPVELGKGMEIALDVDASIGSAESYRITQTASGWRVTGADESGLYFGIGKFLHTAVWTETDLTPNPPTDVVTPECSLRAMYFAVHLHNWYASAPAEELERYVEELILWGYNTVVLIIPVIDIYDFDEENARASIEKSRSIYRLLRRMGMKTGIIIDGNQGLRSAPQELSAEPNFDPLHRRGDAGRNVCPHKPGAVEYMRAVWRGELKQYTDIGLDYLIT